jgi:excisionase family DNA binding protein
VSKLWGIKELADYLGVPEQTIYQWRTKGYGPVGHRIGKYVRFRPEDVERWVDEQTERVA